MGSNDDGTDQASAFGAPAPEEAPPLGATPYLPPPASSVLVGSTPPPFDPWAGATATVVPNSEVLGHKRSKGKMIGGLVAVVALLGAGGFAVTRIVAGNDGGADNPTEVGSELMKALGEEDVLGVVDLLLPGERETMRQPLLDMVDNLKRLEIVDGTATLDKIGGLDIGFEGVEVEPQTTNVDDITNIRITGVGTVSVDGQQVPIGPLLIDEAFGGERPDMDSDPQESTIDWKVTTVKRDGRWYLSLFYTLAETFRDQGGQDIPEASVVARGADAPEGAVQAMFDAVSDYDLEALIAGLNPNEAEALQRYAPLFVDDAQNAIDDAVGTFHVEITDAKYTVNGTGDRRSVGIDAITVHAYGNEEDVTVKISDGCAVVTVDGDTIDSCEDKESIDSTLEALGLGDNEELQSLIDTIKRSFADMRPIGLTVQQVDGKWFLSPIGTFADGLLSVMSALDKGELTEIIHGISAVAESDLFTTGIFGEGGISDVGPEFGLGAFDACFESVEYADFASCVATGIDDGSIEPSFVAPYYRFTGCGVGEQYFDGSIYSMSDTEFVAFVTAAAPCFQQYVDDGTIFSFELPYELSRPECLEGRNWYNVTDQDYNDRVFECAT